MPTMAPGHELSEVELLKWLGAYQWDTIARTLGRATREIVDDAGERLYPSLVDVELGYGERRFLETGLAGDLHDERSLFGANPAETCPTHALLRPPPTPTLRAGSAAPRLEAPAT
jgi:hypothetical protein